MQYDVVTMMHLRRATPLIPSSEMYSSRFRLQPYSLPREASILTALQTWPQSSLPRTAHCIAIETNVLFKLGDHIDELTVEPYRSYLRNDSANVVGEVDFRLDR